MIVWTLALSGFRQISRTIDGPSCDLEIIFVGYYSIIVVFLKRIAFICGSKLRNDHEHKMGLISASPLRMISIFLLRVLSKEMKIIIQLPLIVCVIFDC